MLSAAKISARHVDYYCAYVAGGGDPGVWLGQGATALGLPAAVEEGTFRALAAGMTPEGTEPLVRIQANRTMGWDFTFSAPKSVSLAMALHPDDEVREAVRVAHEGAVAAAVGFLEETAGRSRRGLGGRDGHVAARLVVAGFLHKSSRERDPQLHTHCLVLNLGLGEDGRWGAIDSRFLFRRRMAAAAVYRAELRRGLAALGGGWEPVDARGLSELAGIDRRVLRHFSRRRVDIEHQLSLWAASGPQAAQAATLATRKAKVDVEWEELRTEWATRAGSVGLDGDVLRACLDGTDRRAAMSPAEVGAEARRLVGPDGLTGEVAAFRRDDVVRAWAAAATQGATRAELESLTEGVLGRPEIVALAVADAAGNVLLPGRSKVGTVVRLVPYAEATSPRTELRYTTTDMLAVETTLVDAALRAKATGVSCVRPDSLRVAFDAAAAGGRSLTEEQADMVRALCSSGDGVEVVVGVPGAGKSFALGVARAAWESAGYRVFGCALAAEAAAHLESSSGIPSLTVASLLRTLEAPDAGSLRPNDVVVVDEAAMLDTRRLARLAAQTQAAGAKLVLVGDDRQLPAIEAGGAFSGLATRLGASRLVTNGRQVESWERDALAAVRDGRVAEAASAYVAHGRVRRADDAAALAEATVSGWWASTAAGVDAAMFGYRRASVAELNARARARMAEAGRLSGPELVVGECTETGLAERRYQAGDHVVCLRNRRRLSGDDSGIGVRNGTRATVVSVDPAAGTARVRTTDGRELALPRAYLEGHTDYGFALTIHKSQGKTLGGAARLGGEDGRCRGEAHIYGADDLTAEAALVAASRAADASVLYLLAAPEPAPEDHGQPEQVDSQVALEAAWSRREAKVMALDELDARRRVTAMAEGSDRDDLVARRGQLSMVAAGPGPGPELANANLATILAGLHQLTEEEVLARAAAGAASPEQRLGAQSHLDAAARRRAGVEDEGVASLDEAETREARRSRWHAAAQAVGADVVVARDELALVDDALLTQRRQLVDAIAASPPRHVSALLGPCPCDPAQAMRWRQAIGWVEDVRRDGRASNGEGTSPWIAALGPMPKSGPARTRYVSAVAAIKELRDELGLDARPGESARSNASDRRRSRRRSEERRRAHQDDGWGLERDAR